MRVSLLLRLASILPDDYRTCLVSWTRRANEATPRPRLLIAVGDCACDGGFCRESFAVRAGVGDVAPIDVRIPGCPPRPATILAALLEALGRANVRAMLGA